MPMRAHYFGRVNERLDLGEHQSQIGRVQGGLLLPARAGDEVSQQHERRLAGDGRANGAAASGVERKQRAGPPAT